MTREERINELVLLRLNINECWDTPNKEKYDQLLTDVIQDTINLKDYAAQMESLGYQANGALMNALRHAMGLPELPDKNLRIEAPKIEHELKMIREELHQINVNLKRGLKV